MAIHSSILAGESHGQSHIFSPVNFLVILSIYHSVICFFLLDLLEFFIIFCLSIFCWLCIANTFSLPLTNQSFTFLLVIFTQQFQILVKPTPFLCGLCFLYINQKIFPVLLYWPLNLYLQELHTAS